LRFIDFVYHSTLGLRVIKKKKKNPEHRTPKHETRNAETRQTLAGDTTPCKVTPVILHGVGL